MHPLQLIIGIFFIASTYVQCSKDSDVHMLAQCLCGSFSSEEQFRSDTNFYDVRLKMIRIWPQRADAIWLYVEQAYADALHKPYRQRVYGLRQLTESTIESKVYEMPDPLRFAGAWKDVTVLNHLSPDSLRERPGCSIFLKKTGPAHFIGTTPGKECLSVRKGAAYATAEVEITSDYFKSWDRGFDADGKQVWGSEKGGYIFKKLESYPLE